MMLTVFTPTHQRAYCLPRLYESLKRQTVKNFEWLVIDNGSTDGTPELFETWLSEKPGFEIRYLWQEDGGKHRAINRAVHLAKYPYFFNVDSDDFLTDDAVELVLGWAESIDEMEEFCGVSGLRAAPSGEIHGGIPKTGQDGYTDATNLERPRFDLGGDKAEVYRTQVMKRYPFPEYPGETYVIEDTAWDAMAGDGYKIRWFNRVTYICEYLEDGLTRTGMTGHAGNIKNYRSFANFVRQALRLGRDNKRELFLEYMSVARELGKSRAEICRDLGVTENRLLQLRAGFAAQESRRLAMRCLEVLRREGIRAVFRKAAGKLSGEKAE
ncbi:glycosyltransferase family 2 protein [Papillibacter cinnamivorans]|uniref:Glycosyl transferase family 2 n=1 Tax=Papillibacter cinnamivorans DSM 12816 TaxID=1122930 RepID=A0A1W2CFA0_9FIRM|nr:glycosyltransferase family A protein [Papillibacter cinnamivorans]SMC83654.1 Glycosyl transferase family 2 [Papillibacter cinnamivorans DSM 12816]